MNKIKFLILIFGVFYCQTTTAQTEQELRDLAIENAKTVSKATLDMDFETVLTYTHPNVVELMGGKDNAVTLLKTQFDKMIAEGFVFEIAEVKKLTDFAKEKDTYHCLIELYNQMKMGSSRIKAKSYVFGIYDDSVKHWFFVEANQLKNPSLRDMAFKDFSTSLTLPDDETTTEPIED